MLHPLVEDRGEETAELVGPHRPLGRVRPAEVGGLTGGIDALDDRDELHPRRRDLVSQESVELQRMIGVDPVDRGQDVVLDAVLLEEPKATHHLVEGAGAALVDPVGVVQLAGAVDADADQEVVFDEELAPLVVEQGAVGLHRVQEPHPRPLVTLRDLDGASEEVDTHQGRLASLPGDRDVRCLMGVDQLHDVALERLVRHPESVALVQQLLVEEEAV